MTSDFYKKILELNNKSDGVNMILKHCNKIIYSQELSVSDPHRKNNETKFNMLEFQATQIVRDVCVLFLSQNNFSSSISSFTLSENLITEHQVSQASDKIFKFYLKDYLYRA